MGSHVVGALDELLSLEYCEAIPTLWAWEGCGDELALAPHIDRDYQPFIFRSRVSRSGPNQATPDGGAVCEPADVVSLSIQVHLDSKIDKYSARCGGIDVRERRYCVGASNGVMRSRTSWSCTTSAIPALKTPDPKFGILGLCLVWSRWVLFRGLEIDGLGSTSRQVSNSGVYHGCAGYQVIASTLNDVPLRQKHMAPKSRRNRLQQRVGSSAHMYAVIRRD